MNYYQDIAVCILSIRTHNGAWVVRYELYKGTETLGYVKLPLTQTTVLEKKHLSKHVAKNFAYVKYYLERFIFGNIVY